MLRSFSHLALPAWGINKDLTVWLDGARPPPEYAFKNYEFDELKDMTNLDSTK